MSAVKHGTSIEWTHGDGFTGETWNPVTGCSKVSPGCANCYAETVTARFAGRPGYIEEHRPWTPENAEHNVRLHPERLEQPLRWRSPRMVFVNSMSDLFHELVPDGFIAQVFTTMAQAPQHVFQVLTKRPERARAWFHSWHAFYPQVERDPRADRPLGTPPFLPNVWLGVSIENARFTWRADVLREIPAAVRFVSAEPLLGSLLPDMRGIAPRDPAYRQPLDLTGIDWLIVGGESGGRDARPMHPEWARELRDACLERDRLFEAGESGTAFFFKQWGSWAPADLSGIPAAGVLLGFDGRSLRVGEGEVRGVAKAERVARMRYAGAKPTSGGRELDGRTWDEMPAAA